MVEQSSNNLSRIRDHIHGIENLNGISNQEISKQDNSNQALLEKLLDLEKSIDDKMGDHFETRENQR